VLLSLKPGSHGRKRVLKPKGLWPSDKGNRFKAQ
jgi:hypothetical protein